MNGGDLFEKKINTVLSRCHRRRFDSAQKMPSFFSPHSFDCVL